MCEGYRVARKIHTLREYGDVRWLAIGSHHSRYGGWQQYPVPTVAAGNRQPPQSTELLYVHTVL